MCTHPIILKNGFKINCGRCIQCRKSRINYWAQRLKMEGQDYGKYKLFLTLTYNEDCLRKTGGNVLRKEDYQNFLKRVRYHLNKNGIKIRYYVAGEYGSKFGRKHWHMIIFGLKPDALTYSLLSKCWKYGFIKIEKCQGKVYYYVSKYCVKQFGKIAADCETGELKQEFKSCSQSLGFNFFKKNLVSFCRAVIFGEAVKIRGQDYFNCKLFTTWLKQKFNVKIPRFFSVNIYCNDYRYNNDLPYRDSVNFQLKNFLLDIASFDISSRYYNSFNILPYSSFFSDIEKNNQSELNFCRLKKIDYEKYYGSSSIKRLRGYKDCINFFYSSCDSPIFEIVYHDFDKINFKKYVSLRFGVEDMLFDGFKDYLVDYYFKAATVGFKVKDYKKYLLKFYKFCYNKLDKVKYVQ